MSGARDIYQEHLDAVSGALWDFDFDKITAMMIYPHAITTDDAEAVMQTPAQFKATLTEFRKSLARLGAQEYHRVCSSADFVSNIEIKGRHQTYALSGGRYVLEPFENEMTLHRKNGTWLGAGIRAHIQNINCTIISPLLAHHAQFGQQEDKDND